MKVKYIGRSGPWVTNGKVYEVEIADGGYYHLVNDEGDQNSYPQNEFESVVGVEPVSAPLIDGPGLYLTRASEEVTITRLRAGKELDTYPEHIWEDSVGDCYRSDGTWSDTSKPVQSPFDIVEKVIELVKQEEPVRPKFKPGDKVRLREFAYGTSVASRKDYGSTNTVRVVFKATDNLDGKTQTLHVQHCARDMSSLWFDLVEQEEQPLLRQFESGATRNLDNNKLDYEGFLSPLVIEAFAKYMHSHRLQKDGTMRASDNWAKGIPFDVYMKSGWRHFFDWWKLHRGLEAASPEDGHKIDKVEALCALMFNVQGYLHELLKEQSNA